MPYHHPTYFSPTFRLPDGVQPRHAELLERQAAQQHSTTEVFVTELLVTVAEQIAQGTYVPHGYVAAETKVAEALPYFLEVWRGTALLWAIIPVVSTLSAAESTLQMLPAAELSQGSDDFVRALLFRRDGVALAGWSYKSFRWQPVELPLGTAPAPVSLDGLRIRSL